MTPSLVACCPRCGDIATLASRPSKAPGLGKARALIDAELARARNAHPQENA